MNQWEKRLNPRHLPLRQKKQLFHRLTLNR